jgi:hypothetical protein
VTTDDAYVQAHSALIAPQLSDSRHRIGIGDICLDCNDPPARCGNFARGCFRLNRAGCIVYADRRATRGQRSRNRPPDATGASRHDCYLISPDRHLLPDHAAKSFIANIDPAWVCLPNTKGGRFMRLKDKVAIVTGGAHGMGI